MVPKWRAEPDYIDAMEEARLMAAEFLEDAAIERAVDGMRSYRCNKEGLPVRHPDECDCGHPRAEHGQGPCETKDCECSEFMGRPYYELSYSDRLLETLLRANLPDKYKTTAEIRGLLANIDLNLLPNKLVDRIAAGEPPLAVLASAAPMPGTTTQKLR